MQISKNIKDKLRILILNRKNECPKYEVYVSIIQCKVSIMFPKIFERYNSSRRNILLTKNVMKHFMIYFGTTRNRNHLPKFSPMNFSFTVGSRRSFTLSRNFFRQSVKGRFFFFFFSFFYSGDLYRLYKRYHVTSEN